MTQRDPRGAYPAPVDRAGPASAGVKRAVLHPRSHPVSIRPRTQGCPRSVLSHGRARLLASLQPFRTFFLQNCQIPSTRWPSHRGKIHTMEGMPQQRAGTRSRAERGTLALNSPGQQPAASPHPRMALSDSITLTAGAGGQNASGFRRPGSHA